MNRIVGMAILAMAAASQAQHLDRVYNRDSGDEFKLKSAHAKTRVMGPLFKQETLFTFENPFQKLTEASIWFDLNEGSVLDGFAYWYKDEYVKGVLMDKAKAWFIYTAITSRNEDPGIMVQTAPSSYHAQIYPLAIGYDLRVQLTQLGFLVPEKAELYVPNPTPYQSIEPTYEASNYQNNLTKTDKGYSLAWPSTKPIDLSVYAQRNRDGYVYVAGLVRRQGEDHEIKLRGLSSVYWIRPMAGDTTARYFVGRRKGSGSVTVETWKARKLTAKAAEPVKGSEKGNDTSKLWAHQRLVQSPEMFRTRNDVLKFGMRYQIPSAQTALLAVPQEQMKLFRQKEAEFKRKQKEEARRAREWQRQRQQNWRQSPGGDPELRILMPEAVEAYAVLPDGRRIDMRSTGEGYWGCSYDIPTRAAEGEYEIKIYAKRADGTSFETKTTYDVDRTAPEGTVRIMGSQVVVESEADLARVVIVMKNEDEIEAKSTKEEPTIYRATVKGAIKSVILIDRGHNLKEIPSSSFSR